MTITKREFSAIDAHPSIQYIKKDDGSTMAYPVTEKMLNSGMGIPLYDLAIIDEAPSGDMVITYSLSGTTVAIKNITISGTRTTVSITY
jgi:hypothetical protein